MVDTLSQLSVVQGDREKARLYKERLATLLQPICDLFTEARREDIMLNFVVQQDAMHRSFVGSITAHKEL